MKEAIHSHLFVTTKLMFSSMLFCGHRLRFCYGGQRFSQDPDFICGKRAPT